METQKIRWIASFLSLLPKILKLMDNLTTWKIIILFICLSFVIGCFSIWENRTLLIDSFLPDSQKLQNWQISDKTKTSIKDEVDRHPGVSWVIVTEMDLGANLKKFKYWYNEDQDALQKFLPPLNTQVRNQIFDFNKIHTANTVKVLQNEFICIRIEDSAVYLTVPELKSQSDFVCKIAIPPFYGRFVGVLTIGVRGPMTDELRFSVKAIAANIAATIYWRDVIKLPH